MSTNNPVSGEQVASEEPLGTPPEDREPDERPEGDDTREGDAGAAG